MVKKLLIECVVPDCGHFFQAWTETADDGTWSLHFHVECNCCEQIAMDVSKLVCPGVSLERVS
jgi:hypothetical protein